MQPDWRYKKYGSLFQSLAAEQEKAGSKTARKPGGKDVIKVVFEDEQKKSAAAVGGSTLPHTKQKDELPKTKVSEYVDTKISNSTKAKEKADD